MVPRVPDPITPAEARRRSALVEQVALSVGFVGRAEYRHSDSQSGGARYVRAAGDATADLLVVEARAFDRDADPDDFSLQAIIAHERGHQLFARHPRLAPLAVGSSLAVEEVLASIIGALLLADGPDHEALLEKATFDVLRCGAAAEDASRLIAN